MNKHKQFIKDAYEGKHGSMCSDWRKKILEHYPEFKDDYLKVGKWYKYSDTDKYLLNITEASNAGFVSAFGFSWGKWNGLSYGYIKKGLTPATDKEIESYFTKEIKKRGFMSGAVVDKSNLGEDYNPSNKIKEFDVCFGELISNGYLWIDDILIYDNGKWAEVIKTMTKKEAEEKLNCKIL